MLHLINSAARGGAELYVSELILHFQKYGVENFVVCRKFSLISKMCNNPGIRLYFTKASGKFALFQVFKLVKLIKKEKITTVFSHTRNDVFTGSVLKFLTGICHVNAIYMGTGPKKDAIHRFVYRRVDALITSAEFSKNECERYLPVPPGAVKLIRYGRDPFLYELSEKRRTEIRGKMHTPPEKVVIGLLSRIDTGKGVGIFADAFEYLQQEVQQKIEFWIMGEPTVKSVNAKGEPTYEEQALKLLDKLKALSKKHPTSFKLIPFQTEYIAWLQAMDIFVLPTINEMYSLAVVDAMMTGLPVIGTNAGGTSEQIGRNERGLLVEPGSAKAIADAIAEMIKNPEEMKQKGEAARNWATTQHNFQTTVSQILDVCNEKLPLRNEELPVNLPH